MSEVENLSNFSSEYTEQLDPELQNIIKTAKSELAFTDMFSSEIELSLYRHLIAIGNYSSVLELGMFVGLSTLNFAKAVYSNFGTKAQVITIEPNKRYIDLALPHFEQSKQGSIITVIHDYAKQVIPNLKQTFDFIFIDADKENYPVYYDTLLPKLNPNGTMVIDNVFWRPKNHSQKERKKQVIRQFNEQLSQDSRVSVTYLPIRDGLALIRFKEK
jgi:caffeoyl-CoA O-methyltransferase